MPNQKTYTCRCGKKHPLLSPGVSKKCACGRTASWEGDQLVIKDKPKKP